MQPHRKRCWLTPPADDPVALAEQIRTVCEVCQSAPTLQEQGTHVMSCDEMTGVQALEQLHPCLPVLPSHVEREEFEYRRSRQIEVSTNPSTELSFRMLLGNFCEAVLD